MKCHFIRYMMENKVIELKHVGTRFQLVDIFIEGITKA